MIAPTHTIIPHIHHKPHNLNLHSSWLFIHQEPPHTPWSPSYTITSHTIIFFFLVSNPLASDSLDCEARLWLTLRTYGLPGPEKYSRNVLFSKLVLLITEYWFYKSKEGGRNTLRPVPHEGCFAFLITSLLAWEVNRSFSIIYERHCECTSLQVVYPTFPFNVWGYICQLHHSHMEWTLDGLSLFVVKIPFVFLFT